MVHVTIALITSVYFQKLRHSLTTNDITRKTLGIRTDTNMATRTELKYNNQLSLFPCEMIAKLKRTQINVFINQDQTYSTHIGTITNNKITNNL